MIKFNTQWEFLNGKVHYAQSVIVAEQCQGGQVPYVALPGATFLSGVQTHDRLGITRTLKRNLEALQ